MAMAPLLLLLSFSLLLFIFTQLILLSAESPSSPPQLPANDTRSSTTRTGLSAPAPDEKPPQLTTTDVSAALTNNNADDIGPTVPAVLHKSSTGGGGVHGGIAVAITSIAAIVAAVVIGCIGGLMYKKRGANIPRSQYSHEANGHIL